MTTNNSFFRDPKSNWISLGEIYRFALIPIRFFRAIKYKSSVTLLMKRIHTLVSLSGWTHSFRYLKECFRLVIHSISGNPTHSDPNKIRVRTDSMGLPTIIPLEFRKLLSDPKSNIMIVRLVLTLIQIFRVFPVPVKPDLGSVISPFKGISQSLPMDEIIQAVNILRMNFRWGSQKGFLSEKSGPNGRRATWFSHIDAFAFIHYPRHFLNYFRVSIYTGSVLYPQWLSVLLCVFGPFYLLAVWLKVITPSKLGKLGVVYDQAGKARIVAMANWWIQISLKPLHLSIFRYLRSMSTDGTFDQVGPLNTLVSKVSPGTKFHCFDLTAATDRIPVLFLSHIQSACGVRGDLWMKMMDLPWFYKKVGFITYSVGQAMGAYSSFAMLAVFNHICVAVAARRSGISTFFSDYAVLGDDIVICNDKVASEYHALLIYLGLDISMAKSIISSEFAEFAKKFIGPDVNYTPLGAGVILQASRKKYALGMVFLESIRNGITPIPATVLAVMDSFPLKRSETFTLQQICFGQSGALTHGRDDPIGMIWYSHGERVVPALLRYSYYEGLLQVLLTKANKTIQDIQNNETYFFRNWFRRLNFKVWTFAWLLEAILFFFSPGFWIYALSFRALSDEAISTRKSILAPRKGTWEDIEILTRTHLIPSADISWKDKSKVETYYKMLASLDKEIHRARADVPMVDFMEGDFY